MTSIFICYSTLFFFNDTATTEIYTLSLHDALPISIQAPAVTGIISPVPWIQFHAPFEPLHGALRQHAVIESLLDRKSTRLNSSHVEISYAVFCLKKKKKKIDTLYDRSNTIR